MTWSRAAVEASVEARHAMRAEAGEAKRAHTARPESSHWRDLAACQGVDIDVFFGHNAGRAKALCARCPVSAECLDFALTMERQLWHRHGIFGGFRQRRPGR